MTSIKHLFFLFSLLLVVACGNDDTSSARQAPIQTAPPAPAATTPPPPAATAEPAQNAAGVWHYTCSNGCAGGAGSATACATCGNTLAHNTVYHGNSPTATPNPVQVGGAPAGTPSTMFADPSQPPVNATIGASPAPAAAAPEPAQNAAGIWHYTCSSGCAGGGGSATACATCGNTLVHNQGYH